MFSQLLASHAGKGGAQKSTQLPEKLRTTGSGSIIENDRCILLELNMVLVDEMLFVEAEVVDLNFFELKHV